MTETQKAINFFVLLCLVFIFLIALVFYFKVKREQEHVAILAAHAYTIKIPCGRSYETHYVKKGDYRIENGILYFRKAGKTHIAKGEYIIHEN